MTLQSLGLTQAKFNELYDTYFVEFDSSEWRVLLGVQAKIDREAYKLACIDEIMQNFVLVAGIGDIPTQERAKAGLVELIKDLFPAQNKINAFSDLEEIYKFLDGVRKSQVNVLKTYERDEAKKAESVYSVVAKISKGLGLALQVGNLTVLEFLAYYKEYRALNE